MATRFQRANIVVESIDRSLVIYRDILGLTVDYIKDSLPSSYSYPVFEIPREATLRFCTLSSEEQVRTLALTEVTGIDLPDTPRPQRSCNVFQVDDVGETVDRLKQVPGVTLYEEETLHTQDGRVGRELGFVDPDGHLVVIYSIAPA